MKPVSVLFALAVLAWPARSLADTLRVPEDYASIQSALDAAQDGDVVSVAAGVYRENVDFLGHAVLLTSREGPQNTVIEGDGTDSVVAFVSGEGPGAILRGFTVRGGGGRVLDLQEPDYRYGGGILCLEGSSPLLEGNWVQDNVFYSDQERWSGEGAGIYVGPGCAPQIVGNEVFGNSVGGYETSGIGGGIAVVQALPWIHHNVVRNNYSGAGGGIACNSSAAVIEWNEIRGNIADWGSLGGGLLVQGGPAATVRDNWIVANHAYEVIYPPYAAGGGMAVRSASVRIERNHFVENGSEYYGGGLAVQNASGVEIVDNTFVRNVGGVLYDGRGGAIHFSKVDGARVEGNTFVDNVGDSAGPAIEAYSSRVEISGCVVWNGAGALTGSIDRVSYSDVEGGWSGAGEFNLDEDPCFVDPLVDRFDLFSFSPCIDQGPPDRWEAVPTLDGLPRVLDGDLDRTMRVDMGAYEFGNVRLEVSGEPVPGGQLLFRTTGTPRMVAFLFVGFDLGATLLPPYGALFLDPSQGAVFFPFAVVPDEKVLMVPPDLQGPVTLVVQELAVKFFGRAGNFSNAVPLHFE